MHTNLFIDALSPITQRVSSASCWVKRSGNAPKHVKSPLSRARLEQHFASGPFYGAAPIGPGQSTTLLALLDFDDHGADCGWQVIIDHALKVLIALEQKGLKPIPFRSSGGNGVHLYLLWNTAQDARSVRILLANILQSVGLKSGTAGVKASQVEIFPKQDCVPADGWGNMFILPLANQSVPLDSFEMELLPREAILNYDWPVCPDVETAPAEEIEQAPAVVSTAELAEVKKALEAIPNTGDNALSYDDWRNIVFAIHHATDGSAEGLALAHEFSAQSSKYNADFLEKNVWPYIKTSHGNVRGAITENTIFAMARQHGYVEDVASKFDIISPPETKTSKRDLPSFQRNKDGSIMATISNLELALRETDVCHKRIRYDEFKDEVLLAPEGTEEWRPITDKDVTDMRIYLERSGNFDPVGKEMTRDVFDKVARDNSFDSAIFWLENLPAWDGKHRVEHFLTRYFEAEKTRYSMAVARYMWSAMAGRILTPGIQADMAPIFVGAQGIGKTQGIKAIVPSEEFYVEVDLQAKDDNLARKMRGKIVGELAELRGMSTRDLDGIKAFLTRSYEEWVPKFKEFSMKYPRRLLFIGTTNTTEFLADESGERRFLPIQIHKVDVDAIKRDRLQLWAEAVAMYKTDGILWKEAKSLAIHEHAEFKLHDIWEDTLLEWLDEEDMDGVPNKNKPFSTRDALSSAIGCNIKDVNRSQEMRMNKILLTMEFSRNKSVRTDKGPRKLWEKTKAIAE